MTKKMTKRDHFNSLLSIPAVAENPDLVTFINHELELLERKNSAEKKPTAQQVANQSIKDEILACMVDDTFYTITDLIKAVPVCNDMTNQRVSALVRQLVEAEKVVKVVEKRKSFFRKA